jgi:THO complex subunit 2
VKNVWDKVRGLIGYFDLDPNRALDIVLDVFSMHLASHHTFFLALLRQSHWCRSSSEVSNIQEVAKEGLSFTDILRHAEDRKPSESETEKIPVCAQVMGFKFVFYQVRFILLPFSGNVTGELGAKGINTPLAVDDSRIDDKGGSHDT